MKYYLSMADLGKNNEVVVSYFGGFDSREDAEIVRLSAAHPDDFAIIEEPYDNLDVLVIKHNEAVKLANLSHRVRGINSLAEAYVT